MLLKSKNDVFVFWNCANGVFGKKLFIQKYIDSAKPSLFFVSECDLTQNMMLELMNIDGYSIEVAKTLDKRKKGRLMG
jgi:hypothetical protein